MFSKKWLSITFLYTALPNLLFIIFLIVGYFAFLDNQTLDPLGLKICLYILIFGIPALPFLFLILLCLPALFIFIFPIWAISDSCLGYNTDSLLWFLWFFSIVIEFTNLCAYNLCNFKDDESYVSGSHIEGRFETINGKLTAIFERVPEFSGDTHFYYNCYLWILKFFLLAFGGIIIFLIKIIATYKNNAAP